MKKIKLDVNHIQQDRVEISKDEYLGLKTKVSELEEELLKVKKAKNFFYRHQIIVKTHIKGHGVMESYDCEDYIDDEAIKKLKSEIKRLDTELSFK